MKKVGIIFFLLVILGVMFLFRTDLKELFAGKKTINQTEVKLLIPKNPSYSDLALLLVSKKVVETKEDVLSYFIEHNNPKISGGKYIVKPGEKLDVLLDGFVDVSGHGKKEVKVKVLFNHFRTLNQMAGTISTCIQADSSSIIEYLGSESTHKLLELNWEELPSLFIPMTYEMYYDSDARDFVLFMKEKYESFWTKEKDEKWQKLGLKSRSQAVTLASIVYSEQGADNGEWPKIAGLYLNRLKRGIPLQSDPTALYCWGDAADTIDRVYYKHLQLDCPYNTYKHSGLPPGPITFVPYKVVDDILDAESHNYIYMCAKPGALEHNFTDNELVHKRNAKSYQDWKNRQEATKQ